MLAYPDRLVTAWSGVLRSAAPRTSYASWYRVPSASLSLSWSVMLRWYVQKPHMCNFSR